MTDQTMIERMARATYAGNQWHRWIEDEQCYQSIPWEELDDEDRRVRQLDAKNALIALREPTEAMVKAGTYVGVHFNTSDDIALTCQMMIDAALAEAGKG